MLPSDKAEQAWTQKLQDCMGSSGCVCADFQEGRRGKPQPGWTFAQFGLTGLAAIWSVWHHVGGRAQDDQPGEGRSVLFVGVMDIS